MITQILSPTEPSEYLGLIQIKASQTQSSGTNICHKQL